MIVAVAPAEAAATITGSRDELASAFGNLVSNAVRYTPDGGTITLSWEDDADGGDDAGVVEAVWGGGAGVRPD